MTLTALFGWQRQASLAMPDFDAACDAGEPWFVAAAQRGQTAPMRYPEDGAPAVVLFRDSPDNGPHYKLATFGEVGTVFGLGYSMSERAVYAAAYRKRSSKMGPLGPGGVYRIDLNTGEVAPFLTVPRVASLSGPRHSNGKLDHDLEAGIAVGRVGLGDLELSTDERELYVTNLGARRIYRYGLPDGDFLGSFAHGALSEPWSENARPFGLAYWKGHVYHGVVNEGGSRPGAEAAFVANVYRSKPDGSDMSLVATLPLNYPREPVALEINGNVVGSDIDWGAWEDGEPAKADGVYPLHQPQPMLTDIVIDEQGRMAIGLRDRYWDISSQWIEAVATYGPTVTIIHGPVSGRFPSLTVRPPSIMAEAGIGFGDLLYGEIGTAEWQPSSRRSEFFDDDNALRHAESAFGSAACVAGTDAVASTHFGVERLADRWNTRLGTEGVYWFAFDSGNRIGQESLYDASQYRDYDTLLSSGGLARADTLYEIFNYLQDNWRRDLGSLGDIETLCNACEPAWRPDHPSEPSPAPTEPPPAVTPTSQPVASETPPPPPIYLPSQSR